MNRNSEIPLVAADAFVMYYDNMLGKWLASGVSKSVTVAKVQLLQNMNTNQFRIFAWNPINKEILVSSVLYYNLRYQKAHATFHEWRDADTQVVYGLHFADAKEAHVFGDGISKVFLSLESIYHQCRELQAVIRANVPAEQYDKQSSNLKVDTNSPNFKGILSANQSRCEVKSNEYYPNSPVINTVQYSQIQRSDFVPISKIPSSNRTNKHSISIGSSPNTNSDFTYTHVDLETEDLPNYENISSIILKHSEVKSLSIGSDNLELSNNRCQSSSDDSVRGLKRQPSSTSSGYATVASMADQYSPTPGLTSSFSMVAEALNKSICDSKSQVQNYLDFSNVPMHETSINVEESVQSAFASQLQNMIQLRKQNHNIISSKVDFTSNFSLRPENNQKIPEKSSETVVNTRESKSTIDNKVVINTKPKPPADDIMSEMKLKLQRRKQLIDGHTDPNYSSSTEKSDVCSSSASDAGSFVSNADNSIENKALTSKCVFNFDGSTSQNLPADVIISNKVLSEEEDKSLKLFDEMRDVPSNLLHLKKRSTGDIMQMTTPSSILASKDDLERIKQEISNDFRKELVDVKKEVLDAIKLQQNVSS